MRNNTGIEMEMESMKLLRMSPRVDQEIQTWGQVAGSLISLATVTTLLFGFWTSLEQYRMGSGDGSGDIGSFSDMAFLAPGGGALCDDLFRHAFEK